MTSSSLHIHSVGRTATGVGLTAAVCVMALLRITCLASDPYRGLDWSSGLLTDEGFYIHNARNVVLFGRAITDDFNNMFLSPLLHLAQVAVFRAAGVGSVQARSISVACGLASVAVLYAALRRGFGARVAIAGAAFLGLDHVFVLFNRMALMDTPAALLAVCSFYCFVRAGERPGVPAPLWITLCGLFLGATVVTRGLGVYLLAAPVAGIASWGKGALRRVSLAAAGALLVPAWYVVAWYLPYAHAIQHMNSYYLHHQIEPGSLHHLAQNLYHGLLGDHRGVVPYLFRHSPALFAMALCATAAAFLPGLGRCTRATRNSNASVRFLAAWFTAGIGTLSAISYAPGRYTVALWPALCGLAAIALFATDGLPQLWKHPSPARIAIACILTWILAYHAVEALMGRAGVADVLLYLVPSLAAAGVVIWGVRSPAGRGGLGAGWVAPGAIALWMTVNGLWLADWARNITYAQRDLSVWLGQQTPAGASVIGDVAPGLCMDNRLMAISVIPGLCNDHNPVERFGANGGYVVMLDGAHREPWWVRRYPGIVQPVRRLRMAHVIRWDVGIYRIPGRTIP